MKHDSRVKHAEIRLSTEFKHCTYCNEVPQQLKFSNIMQPNTHKGDVAPDLLVFLVLFSYHRALQVCTYMDSSCITVSNMTLYCEKQQVSCGKKTSPCNISVGKT